MVDPHALRQIWVFNNEYTQYMPLPILELQALLGQPALFVFDCCSAGNVVPFFSNDGDGFTVTAANQRWAVDRRNSRGSGVWYYVDVPVRGEGGTGCVFSVHRGESNPLGLCVVPARL